MTEDVFTVTIRHAGVRPWSPSEVWDAVATAARQMGLHMEALAVERPDGVDRAAGRPTNETGE